MDTSAFRNSGQLPTIDPLPPFATPRKAARMDAVLSPILTAG